LSQASDAPNEPRSYQEGEPAADPVTHDIDGVVKIRAGENPNYPAWLAPGANAETVAAFRQYGCEQFAEFGINYGDTSLEIARHLNGRGTIHLFDFQHNVDFVVNRLKSEGFENVKGHGCSSKLLDSYNWSLSLLLQAGQPPTFDYCFIDGAHSWNVDALTFFLADRLLTVGGYIDFDDYSWAMASSPTVAPKVFPRTTELYTDQQIEDQQVKRIVDLLVKPHPRYAPVVENKIYRKLAHDGGGIRGHEIPS
jgi:predicted O-methyltransferase YrrM